LRRGNEGGETLVEILISIVIIGLVSGAIFATYATSATAAKSQRDFVTADAELRDYAEAVQAAAQACKPGALFSVTAPTTPYPATSNAPATCPDLLTVVPVALTVTPKNDTPPQILTTYVRTP
jgi:type II secretory pathway pseudopilin PulG